jgi:flagellar motor switch protein FliM
VAPELIRKLTTRQKESIRNLIRAVRQSPTRVQDYPDLRDFDWKVPTRYVGESLEALRDFAVKASRTFGDSITELLGAEVKFGEPTIEQFYGAETRRIVAESNDYIMPLSYEDREVGVIILPSATAVSWVQKLLGGILKVAENDRDRDLSHLESEILLECVDCILGALNGFFENAGGDTLNRARSVRRKYEIAADKAETYCMITLPDKFEDGFNSILLLLPGEALDIPAGLQEKSQKRRGGPADADKMRDHVLNLEMSARACLDNVELPMRLVMSLEPGDVLLSHKRVNQPVELLADDTPLAIGYPVRSEFNFGLLIAAPEDGVPPHLENRDQEDQPEEAPKSRAADPDSEWDGEFLSQQQEDTMPEIDA